MRQQKCVCVYAGQKQYTRLLHGGLSRLRACVRIHLQHRRNAFAPAELWCRCNKHTSSDDQGRGGRCLSYNFIENGLFPIKNVLLYYLLKYCRNSCISVTTERHCQTLRLGISFVQIAVHRKFCYVRLVQMTLTYC